MRFRLQTWGLALTSSDIGTDKFYILYGPTNTGKSGEIAILQSLVGKSNFSTLQIDEIADRFQLPQLESYMANLPDDSGIVKASVGADLLGKLKGIISFKEFNVNPKNMPPRKAIIKWRPWFPTNHLPEIPVTSNELKSRALVLPFNVIVLPPGADKYDSKHSTFYANLIENNLSLIRSMAVGGLIDYTKSDLHLCWSRLVKEATDSWLSYLSKKYAGEQNYGQLGVGPIPSFIRAKKNILKKGSRKIHDIYGMYKRWCVSSFVGLSPMSREDFSERFSNYFVEDSSKNALKNRDKIYKLIK